MAGTTFAAIAADAPQAPAQGELLYNGIRLPAAWPRKDIQQKDLQQQKNVAYDPPYLKEPPKVIPIDVGRQLFVDNFLIEQTTLKQTFHKAEYYEGNPILKPEKPWEMTGRGPMAIPFSGGVWYDPAEKIFKMWYSAGSDGEKGNMGLATSKDAIHWERPDWGVKPGTNLIQCPGSVQSTVWLDLTEKDPARRYKLTWVQRANFGYAVSGDGIHFTDLGLAGTHGDRSTFAYNPFRQVWVLTLRHGWSDPRLRIYGEMKTFGELHWQGNVGRPAMWCGADELDLKRPDLQTTPELYNLDLAPYESIMLGYFCIWRGTTAGDAATLKTEAARKDKELGRPKINEVCMGFSRDGWHFSRPVRTAFLGVSKKPGDWNWGNVQSTAGGCLVMGDKLYIYVSGRAGKLYPGSKEMDTGASTGLAFLRRDGFASMDAGPEEASLTTRPVSFKGKYFFVNVNNPKGELRVEALDEKGNVIAPFTKENSKPVAADKTLVAMEWKGADDLSALAGKPVRFRFYLKNGSLYAFWVSPDKSGASYGYVAAGGPAFTGPTDTVGSGSSAN